MNVDSSQLDKVMAEGDDLLLVHASKRGDVSAFEQLVCRKHFRTDHNTGKNLGRKVAESINNSILFREEQER